jgi:copper oxidase (laccase) domain-containing protein
MIDIVAIETQPSGSKHLEHITKLYWIETTRAGVHGVGSEKWSTRAQMYEFVKNNPNIAYAISRNDNRWAYLEPVHGAGVNYVRTRPDSTRTDNLLSLPRRKR